jgi:hypothetical protein
MSGALVASLLAFGVQAAEGRPKIVRMLPLGAGGQIQSEPSLAATPFYSNITTFSGSGFTFGGTLSGQPQPGGGTGRLTSMSCDDLTLKPGIPNGSYALNQVSFSIANFSSNPKIEPTLIFFDQASGTLIDGVAFNPMIIPPPGMIVTADLSLQPITFPLDANGEANIWMCQMYADDNGTILTPLDDLGAFLCDPPTVGSSPDNLYISDLPLVPLYSALPPGIQGNFGGSPIANYCNELSE